MPTEEGDARFHASISTQPAFELTYFFPGLHREDTECFEPDNPFEDIRVREAFARAINRDEIIDVAFGGLGEPAHVLACHPNDPCFDPQWEDDLFELYGYDPDRSRQLLADAGYPDGFSLEMAIYELGGFPELGIATDIVASLATNVGITTDIISTDYQIFRENMTDGPIFEMFGLALLNTEMTAAVRSTNYSEFGGTVAGPQRIVLDDFYQTAIEQPTDQDRFSVEMDIGSYRFYEYLELPIAWVPAVALIDTSDIFDYVFPGTVPGIFSHLEYVNPVR